MTLLFLFALAALVIDARIRTALLGYVLFTGIALSFSYPGTGNLKDFAVFVLLALVKLVAGPASILWLEKHRGLRNDLRPSFPLGGRIAVVLAALGLAHLAARLPAFADIHNVGLVFFALATSIAVVIAHRSLIANAIGLLALGSTVSLAAVVFVPHVPMSAELADTFDALLATLVGLAIAREIARENPELDVRGMRELRG